jgi:tetratricopeptide (TPR) repeat protein
MPRICSIVRSTLVVLYCVLTTSPRFYEARLLWADFAILLMGNRRHLDDLKDVMQQIDRAEELLPHAPRTLRTRFRALLLAGRLDDADATLESLRALRSSQLTLLDLEADLLEARGRMDEALERMRQSMELRPTATSLLRLASAEVRAGHAQEARKHLHQLLELVPGSALGLSKLAEVELSYGDLAQSEQLYRQLLIRDDRRRNYWTNLGIAQYLQGHFDDAAASYRQALNLAPGHPLVLVNLAGAEFARGNVEAGRTHCERALELLQRLAEQRSPGPQDALLEAHCLVRTGKPGAAVAAAQKMLRHHPENAEVAYQAAVVYALAGERLSAIASARSARQLGTGGRWFRVPEFAPLADEPHFESLLEEPPRMRSTEPNPPADP